MLVPDFALVRDTTERVLERGVRLKHPLDLRDQDRLHWKGKRRDCLLTTLFLLQDSPAPCGEVGPEPPVPPAGEENRWGKAENLSQSPSHH